MEFCGRVNKIQVRETEAKDPLKYSVKKKKCQNIKQLAEWARLCTLTYMSKEISRCFSVWLHLNLHSHSPSYPLGRRGIGHDVKLTDGITRPFLSSYSVFPPLRALYSGVGLHVPRSWWENTESQTAEDKGP